MSEQLAPCPECKSEYTYESGLLLACPMCGHEWSTDQGQQEETEQVAEPVIKDAVGNALQDGDTVTIVRDLKVKGGGGSIKIGTKVTGIRLLEEPVAGHDIDARVPGFGQMQLKSSVVKKVL